MSLRKKFRDWKVRRIVLDYAWARQEWKEWNLRFYVETPEDEATRAYEMDNCARTMRKCISRLYWDYGYELDTHYRVGHIGFYMWPTQTEGHETTAMTLYEYDD